MSGYLSDVLEREAFIRAIEVNMAMALDEFPVVAIFLSTNGGQPRKLEGEVGLQELEFNEKRLVDLHSQPATPDRFSHTRMGQVMVRLLYAGVSDRLRSNELAKYRVPGMGNNEGNKKDALLARINKIIAKGVRAIFRTWEKWCIELITGTSFVQVIDSSNNTTQTSVTMGSATATWVTASTDILADLGRFYEEYVDQAGEDPTHMIYSFLMTKNFAKNDKIRAWANNQFAGGAIISDIPTQLLNAPMQNAKRIIHKSHYKDSAGTKTYLWPSDKLVFLSVQGGADVLEFLTTTLLIPDDDEPDKIREVSGIFDHQWGNPKTLEHWIAIRGVGGPAIGDTDKIMGFDLVP